MAAPATPADARQHLLKSVAKLSDRQLVSVPVAVIKLAFQEDETSSKATTKTTAKK